MTVLTSEINVCFPASVNIGNGSLANLAAQVGALQPKSMLLLSILPLLPQLNELISTSEAFGVTVYVDTQVEQEPSFIDYERLVQAYVNQHIELVIGIGGGSVLDVAKLVAVGLKTQQSLADMVGKNRIQCREVALYCVPTTAGTGSEASPNAILIDPADNQKKGIISPHLVPDLVCVDPLLMHSVPPAVTAATGLDALTHCLEAYINKFSHPFIDMYALEGIKLISANLVRAVHQGDDADARYQIAMGSLLGGFCLGPVNTAAVHALAYPLGTSFHIAHGLSNALLLPHVMAFSIPAAPIRYAAAAQAMGCAPQADDINTAFEGVKYVEQMIAACKLPNRLRDLGIPKTSIVSMAQDAMKITRLLVNNPREITLADAIAIYEAAY